MIRAKIVILAAATALLLTFGTSPVLADGWKGFGGGHAVGSGHGVHGHGGLNHRLHDLLKHKQALGITEEQIVKLKTLALDQDRARIRARAEVMIAGRELRSLLSDDKAELSVIEAKVNEQEALEGKLRMIGIKGKRDLYAMLTAEQREKYRLLRDQIRHASGTRMTSADSTGTSESGDVNGVPLPSRVETFPDAPSSSGGSVKNLAG